ncbi:MAG TPA: tripartite tricarboxylate transporter substrate binding protein [Burkholderiaceae bacterium]|nr:tripartite tricarboxylate transporter substrate binding protein [Burkholderiaceae bacterium]
MRLLITAFMIALTHLAGLTASAHAQDVYPSKPVRLVVPLPSGGPTDLLARIVAQHLSQSLGQPVIVDNKPGADGAIGAREVMSASADGHTLLFAPGSLLAGPLQARPPAFDWLSEFVPIGKAGRLSFCLMVHPDLPVRSVADLVAYARANPDKLSYSTATLSELMAASQFMRATDTRMVRVPYKGGMQAMPDLLAGRIQVMFGPVTLAQPHMKSGAIRVLAALQPQRSAAMPDVPTIGEAGVAGVSVPTWQSIFAPARTPRPIVDRLAGELSAVMSKPEVRAELERRAIIPEAEMPQALAVTVAQDQAAWTRLIADYKLGAQ